MPLRFVWCKNTRILLVETFRKRLMWFSSKLYNYLFFLLILHFFFFFCSDVEMSSFFETYKAKCYLFGNIVVVRLFLSDKCLEISPSNSNNHILYIPIHILRKCKRAPLCFDCTIHNETECEFYLNSGLNINFLFDHFNVVTPVRCLLLASSNRAKFDEMMTMEAHTEERRVTDIWNAHEKKVVRPLLENKAFDGKMENLKVTSELIQRICGFFDVNSFEIRGNMDDAQQEESLIRGLYPKAALMAHNCVSNTLISVDGDANLRLYVTTPVKKGEMLFYNYTRSLFVRFDRLRVSSLHKQSVFYFCREHSNGEHISSLENISFVRAVGARILPSWERI